MITIDKLEHHITHLEEKHRAIELDITKLYEAHGNDLKIETLKKVKLHIKDQIEKCKTDIAKMKK
jgi:hypothetical protein